MWTKTGLNFIDLEEGIEIPRGTLISVVQALGGPALSARASNEQIVAALRAIVLPIPNTIAEVDAELVKPLCSMSRRVELMQRRAVLTNGARASRTIHHGDLVVNAPDGVSNVSLRSGRTVNCEIVDGRRVFRLYRGEFDQLRCGGGWDAANPELVAKSR